jgi:NDP-sugar pyrophosphorylase family protein
MEMFGQEGRMGFARILEKMVVSLGSSIPEGLDISVDESKGPVHIDPRAIVEPNCHFIGPCYIAPEATIRHGAYVREHSWISWQALLGHCSEIKHSILLPKAKAPHFNYVGDSVVGSDANLGAGVILSNLRNDGNQVILRVGKSIIPSGLRKFGALVGDGVQIGCNSVTNPGTILGTNCMVYPTTSLSGVHTSDTVLR